MEDQKLDKLSVEELLKKQKLGKLATGLFAGALIALLFIGIFITFKKQSFSVLILIPIGLLPILILNLSTLKKFENELNLRKIFNEKY